MTQRPNQTPTWAEVPTFGNPGAVEPNGAKKLNGFNFTEKPGAGVHNFLFQLLSRWLAYFIERVDGVIMSFVTLNLNEAGTLTVIARLKAPTGDEAIMVLSGGDKLRYTTDGVSVIARTFGGATTAIASIECDNDGTRTARWMAAITDGTGSHFSRSSDRGQTWVAAGPVGVTGTKIQHVSAGAWIAIAGTVIIRTANNGVDLWAAAVAGSGTIGSGHLHYNKSLARGLFVGQGIFPITAAGRKTSDGGATWTAFTVPSGLNTIVDTISGVMSDGVVWVLATSVGMFWTTDSNLNVWTACTMLGEGDFSAIKAERIRYDADGGWIAFDGPVSNTLETTVWSSRDGKTWTRKVRLLGSQVSQDAAFVNGAWIITRTNGRLSLGMRMG
jgi:hypothetical protein